MSSLYEVAKVSDMSKVQLDRDIIVEKISNQEFTFILDGIASRYPIHTKFLNGMSSSYNRIYTFLDENEFLESIVWETFIEVGIQGLVADFRFYKMKDEWFYLNCKLIRNSTKVGKFTGVGPQLFKNLYYKCDQATGLVEAVNSFVDICENTLKIYNK